jgi:hypothetical protein
LSGPNAAPAFPRFGKKAPPRPPTTRGDLLESLLLFVHCRYRSGVRARTFRRYCFMLPLREGVVACSMPGAPRAKLPRHPPE